MLPPVDIAVVGAIFMAAHNNNRSYERFIISQDHKRGYRPSRGDYYLAIEMTWDTNNPPPPPYFKTKLALVINAAADLLPGSK